MRARRLIPYLRSRGVHWSLWAGLLLCFAGIPHAQAQRTPDTLLGLNGYPPDAFGVVFAWDERARRDESVMVQGCRVAPVDGSALFDLYFDETTGILLDADALAELGIVAKDWSPRGVRKDAEIHPGFPKRTALVTPVPKTLAAGLVPAELALPPIDLEAVLLEDALGLSTPAKEVERIGVFQDFPRPVEVGAGWASEGLWQDLPDGGRIWTLVLYSPEALGQRVHFPTLALPAGVRLIVYNADNPAEAYGPFASRADFWSPTCFNEAVAVECYVPAGVAADGLFFDIDRITHNYRPIMSELKAGSCNLDVTCYPAWATVALGVGAYGIIGVNGSIRCTGSLMADEIPETEVPYFLTANHCVSAQAGYYGADSVEVFWLYQTSTCNGTPPSIADLPRTSSGAVYLAGSSTLTGNDFTLLRLRDTPPAGLTYLGYEAAGAAVGIDITCIHHPQGSFKRISFGAITDGGSPSEGSRLKPIELFHEVLWGEGTTEGGSSGSPLLLDAGQRIIGQLYGGLASCTYPDEPDYYGRFDVTYPVIEPLLTPPAESYTLTIRTEGNGSTVPPVGTHTYPETDEITLLANPASGWVFDHWSGDVTGISNPVTFAMGGNKTVTAVFLIPEKIPGICGATPRDGTNGGRTADFLVILFVALALFLRPRLGGAAAVARRIFEALWRRAES